MYILRSLSGSDENNPFKLNLFENSSSLDQIANLEDPFPATPASNCTVVDNLVAINSYKSLGFTFAGEKMPGSREGKFFQHMVRDFSK